MHFKINKCLVSTDWLFNHINYSRLIILDCTIPAITEKQSNLKKKEKKQIKGAIFIDIKNAFSDKNSEFPNTVLSAKDFEIKAQNLGINNNSLIICYDDLGIYSSARVWWMFQLMGFKNIAVLDGGFPEWQSKKYPVEFSNNQQLTAGNFKINYHSDKIKHTEDIKSALKSSDKIILDARSKERFHAVTPEPRKNIRGGHIPNSKSFPFSEILVDGKMISEEKLQKKFLKINPNKKEMIFSCGTGITASILALGAEILNYNNYSVYDGSWTEWASTEGLPIEK